MEPDGDESGRLRKWQYDETRWRGGRMHGDEWLEIKVLWWCVSSCKACGGVSTSVEVSTLMTLSDAVVMLFSSTFVFNSILILCDVIAV